MRDVVGLLSEKGLLTELHLTKGNAVDIPEDVRIVGATLNRPLLFDDSELVIALENDKLPDECFYRGTIRPVTIQPRAKP